MGESPTANPLAAAVSCSSSGRLPEALASCCLTHPAGVMSSVSLQFLHGSQVTPQQLPPQLLVSSHSVHTPAPRATDSSHLRLPSPLTDGSSQPLGEARHQSATGVPYLGLFRHQSSRKVMCEGAQNPFGGHIFPSTAWGVMVALTLQCRMMYHFVFDL